LGTTLALAPIWSKIAALLILLALFMRERKGSLAIIVLAVFMSGTLNYSLHRWTLEKSLLYKNIGNSTLIIFGEATTDPKRTRSAIVGNQIRSSQLSFLLRTSQVESEDGERIKVRVPIRVVTANSQAISPGSELKIRGKLYSSREKRVAALLVVDGDIAILAPPGHINRFLQYIRTEFRSQLSPWNSEAASLIPGMVIGDTSLQSEEFTERMVRAGLSHLTAVSGANFAIVSAFFFWISQWFIRSRRGRIIATAIFLLAFIGLVRPSPSVLRAGVMAGIVLLARFTGEKSRSASVLAAAVILLITFDPFQAFDPGFILSVLATAGLIFLAPTIEIKLANKVGPLLATPIAISTAATALCIPYILWFAGEISLGTVIVNVLVAPVVPILTILGFLALLLTPISPTLAYPLLLLGKWSAEWIVLGARIGDYFPLISFNLILALLLVILFLYLRKLALLSLLLTTVFLIAYSNFPGDRWIIGQCDVGQGDALLIRVGEKDAILIDTGPHPQKIARCLRSFGISRLPLVVITHGHADHFYGYSGISEKVSGELWLNREMSEISSSSTRIVSAGDQAQVGEALVEVLWPEPSFQTSQMLGGEGSSENNQSITLLITLAGLKILATGDLEPQAQQQLDQRYDLSGLSIIKVAHHGSKFQDRDLYREVAAKIALISVGRGNTFGHPSPETLDMLAASGSTILRTDQDGHISLSLSRKNRLGGYIFATKGEGNESLQVRTLGKQWWRFSWR
jgi:competence protein ComEC